MGHVQKRMESRLRKLKSNMCGKKLDDNKPLSSKGRLTDNLVQQITLYYGNTIRANKSSLMDMRKAIYYHKRSTDDEVVHNFCPIGLTPWCEYQRFKAERKEGSYRHKNVLPAAVIDYIKPIFRDLSNPDLLRLCLGGVELRILMSHKIPWYGNFTPKIVDAAELLQKYLQMKLLYHLTIAKKGDWQS